MRKLNVQDLANCAQMLKRIGFKDAVKSAPDGSINDANDLMWLILDCAGADRNIEIFRFLAPVFEMSVEELQNTDIDTMFELFDQFSKMNDLRGFFVKLVGRMHRN